MRRTKIIATIGPASDGGERLDGLVAAGIDVARLNSSHSGITDLTDRIAGIRAAADRAGRNVAVMLDLAGPKVRVGTVEPGIELEPGQTFSLEAGECVGDATKAFVNYASLADDVSPGDRILLDDGRIELRVESADAGVVRTKVVAGGALLSRKGVNVPGVSLGVGAITDYDREVLAWGIRAGVDYIAQSFVRSADDIRALRELMGDSAVPIVAKIEKHEAIAHVDDIVAHADAVMVARGDLGVETSSEDVPVMQRRIVSACRKTGTPVIVATQMLESMVTSPTPTRAEASDVANAIFEGADAIMLSAETAVGEYPLQAVATMDRIARTAETAVADDSSRGAAHAPSFAIHLPVQGRSHSGISAVTHAVSSAVCELADGLEVAAIVTATQSGATARAVARHRPATPVIAITPYPEVARNLALVWGVTALIVALAEETDDMLRAVESAVTEAGLVEPGQHFAVTAGIASRVSGATDFILVREAGSGS